MSIMTRFVTAFAVLSAAAIPVAALTIKNTSTTDVTVGIDNGSLERVYTVPAGQSVEVTEDCRGDCGVTGPWGFSRMVAQNVTVETDGTSLVTATTAATAPSLVPQNPAADVDATPAEAIAAEAKPDQAATASDTPVAKAAPAKRTAKAKKSRAYAAKKKGPGAGSFQLLFQGPGK